MESIMERTKEVKKKYEPIMTDVIEATYSSPQKSYLKVEKMSWGHYYRLNWWGPKMVSGKEQTVIVQSVFCRILPTKDGYTITEP